LPNERRAGSAKRGSRTQLVSIVPTSAGWREATGTSASKTSTNSRTHFEYLSALYSRAKSLDRNRTISQNDGIIESFIASLTYPDASSEFVKLSLVGDEPPIHLRLPIEIEGDHLFEVFELIDTEDWGQRLAGYVYTGVIPRTTAD
jgi:hypothetical protein